jgi:hypothetical protein
MVRKMFPPDAERVKELSTRDGRLEMSPTRKQRSDADGGGGVQAERLVAD